jgi:hypothetical protein
MNLGLFWRYSEEEAIKHDKFNMALHIAEFFFMLDDITEVSDDLLKNCTVLAVRRKNSDSQADEKDNLVKIIPENQMLN